MDDETLVSKPNIMKLEGLQRVLTEVLRTLMGFSLDTIAVGVGVGSSVTTSVVVACISSEIDGTLTL